ncbi:MAG: hypothetical protein LBH25_09185 [Fibromonadaceae bacterium]|jgi:hypothetical protein|nr:hypothetical protein [Fibromonadaceae bacterium]
MNLGEAWYFVDIDCAGRSWKDFNGITIEKIRLGKKNIQENGALFFFLKSLGELDRSFGSIPDNPIQSLTDWTVTMDSIYSLADGSFSTMDVLYHLESINEEFDLIGCNACLRQTDGNETDTVFKCSVVAVSSANGTTSITFSERIGAPTIAKGRIPIVLGNSTGGSFYWPVEISKDEKGFDQIILSETPLERFDGLYIYSEKRKVYIGVEFKHVVHISYESCQVLSPDKTKITFIDKGREIKATEQGYMLSVLRSDADLIKGQTPPEEPVNCLVGDYSDPETAQVWNTQANGEGGFITDLGRLIKVSYQHINSHVTIITPPRLLFFTLEDYPESITETGDQINKDDMQSFSDKFGGLWNLSESRYLNSPFISGDSGLFLWNCREGLQPGLGKYTFPTMRLNYSKLVVSLDKHISHARFSFKFPELELSQSAVVSGFFMKFFFEISDAYCFDDIFFLGDSYPKYGTIRRIAGFSYPSDSQPINFTSDFSKEFAIAEYPTPFSDTQLIHLLVIMGRKDFPKENNLKDTFRLYGLKIKREIRMPYDGKFTLYAGGKPASANAAPIADNGKYVIPAVESLLVAAGCEGYGVGNYGKIRDTEVASIISNESADFRAKLKTLAIASSTLIKFDIKEEKFIASSLEKGFIAEPVPIPLECLLLQNNFYSFSMQTPMKDQVYSGLQISWGKNIATGKYEHIMLVNEYGISHDGENPFKPSEENSDWAALILRLEKNADGGISNLKSMENEWIRSREGAERTVLVHLQWCCTPLRKAQIKCVKNEHFPSELDIGKLACLDLPGYPPKMAETAWLVTAMTDDLDLNITTIGLLEAPDIKASAGNYLLLENRDYINFENGIHIKLED